LDRMFPATTAQKTLLNFRPECSRCLLETDVSTIENCVNVVVFIWLNDGNGYWYFLKSRQGEMLNGYVLVNNRWIYNPIEKRRVLTYF